MKRTCTKQKNFYCSQTKLVAIVAFFIGASLSHYSVAEDAVDNIQLQVKDEAYRDLFKPGVIEQYSKGGFDLREETTTLVSRATGQFIGTSPGIRTIATVNNDEGELRACSTVTIHYQIVDPDGDWDAAEDYLVGVTEDEKALIRNTRSTIEWMITLSPENGGETLPLNGTEYVLPGNLKLRIPEKTMNINGKDVPVQGAKISYQLIPTTMPGSEPAYPANNDFVRVEDLAQGKFLEPGTASGNDAKDYLSSEILTEVTSGALTFPGLPDPSSIENRSFITENIILPARDSSDCQVPSVGVEAVIYDANDVSETNLIDATAWSERKKLSLHRNYRAKVKITDNKGNTRSLTRQEYDGEHDVKSDEERQNRIPFTWNIFYSSDKSCLMTEANLTTAGEGDSCIQKISFDKDMVSATFINSNGIEVLDYAEIDLKKLNASGNFAKAFEESIQGAVVQVEFVYDDLK